MNAFVNATEMSATPTVPTAKSSRRPRMQRTIGAADTTTLRVGRGRPFPLGVHACCDGFNFALFSRHAERVELLLFEDAASAAPYATIPLDSVGHKTGDIWHVVIVGPSVGQAYGYRVDGPWAPEQGHRFDHRQVLLDPYAVAVGSTGTSASGLLADGTGGRNNESDQSLIRTAPKGLLVQSGFDWQGVRRPHRPWSETIIYETHVRGLTIHPSSGTAQPGTFLGLIEKIPYLRALGVTAVELMPIQEFNEHDAGRMDPATSAPLRNYWGYDTAAFFAPKESYATRPGRQIEEFKTMTRELHRAGLEVILDIAFTHTAEHDESGPTLSFRGIDNAIYYMLESGTGRYRDFTGCKNTLNCNHPVVRNLIIDCLRHWVIEMQVDGFRFDLATVLGRDDRGNLLANPPLLEQIAEDPVLRDVKLIAEAWDAAGAYQVGAFSGQRWAEWNGRWRDDVRRFWRGDPGMTGALAWRLCGSADLYQRGKAPVNSINFVAAHDGFTLNDVVSYARKHNEANGEQNRDGLDENFSSNYGVEGDSDDPVIDALRLRQIKNMLATLLTSRGVPMILGGDEFRRTQRGNNNAYAQDNETSWYDWMLAERNGELVRFVRGLVAFRKQHPVLSADSFYSDREIRWFDTNGNVPDWERANGQFGCLIMPSSAGLADQGTWLSLLFNPRAEAADFSLPRLSGERFWRVAIDTSEPFPRDMPEPGTERPLAPEAHFALWPHSVVVLVAASKGLGQ